MKHRIGFNRLDRRAGHRQGLEKKHGDLPLSLRADHHYQGEGLEVRRDAEKLLTRAKVDSVANRRIAGRRIHDEAVLAKLFKVLGPRYSTRPGGYTRILKLGRRRNDAAEMVILELVDRTIRERKTRGKKGETVAAEPEAEKTAKAGA